MKLRRILPAALAALLAMSGCVSKEQKKENAQNLMTAEVNAVRYIEEKYGFKAEVIRSEVDRYAGLFGPEFNGYVYVSMKHSGRNFTVYIDGRENTTDGIDDYQSREIVSDLEDAIESAADCRIKDIFISNHNFSDGNTDEWENLLMYKTYYDGSNFDELAEEECFDCVVRLEDDAELSALSEGAMEDIFCGNNGTIFTGNGRDDGQFSELGSLLTDIDYNQFGYKYAMYLSETVSLTEDDGYCRFAPDVSQCGEMYYMSEGAPVMVSETHADSASEWDGHGSVGGEICSGAYAISRTDDSVWVYFDRRNLPEDGESSLIAYSWLPDLGERSYFCGPQTDTVGGYLVRELEPDSDGFYCVVISN